MTPLQVAEMPLGDLPLTSGGVLRDARLVYAFCGTLSSQRDNVVLYPTHFGGTHLSNLGIIGPGQALDPTRYFIVIPNLFGNGLSTSPSSAHPTQRGASFPMVSAYDNVHAQAQLLWDRWRIDKLHAVYGWSMGGQQAMHWAARYPDNVSRAICCCGSSRTSNFNRVFLEGISAALRADTTLSSEQVKPTAGLRAFARVYAGWAYSHSFFNQALYRELGLEDSEELLAMWESEHLQWNAYDLLAMIDTWASADVASKPEYNGDLVAALAEIKAAILLLPSSTDQYFQSKDNLREAKALSDCRYIEIPSQWGHMAGSPSRGGEDQALINAEVRRFLSEER